MSAVPEVMSARNRHNVMSRHHGADHPDVIAARRALELARTEAKIRKAIAAAPPLTAEQIEQLRALLPAPIEAATAG